MFEGPIAYRLWKAHLSAPPSKEWAEFLLYSDSHIPSEIMEGLGPFQVFSALPDQRSLGFARPVLCLRVNFPDVDWREKPESAANADVGRKRTETESEDRSDDSFYHGKGYTDEIASLISLILGVRLKAGPESRIAFGDGDTKGKPIHMNEWKKPILSPKYDHKPSVPEVYKDSKLVLDTPDIDLLKAYPRINPKAAIALVRAARLYQEAIWIAETEPSTSWLFLVSAIETAAVFWKKKSKKSEALFREHYPDLTKQILEQGSEGLLKLISATFAHTVKVTDKFLDFSLHFMPDAPSNRAAIAIQEWEPSALTNTLKIIYSYRSNALHSGIPFPPFMNDPPHEFDGLLTETFPALSGRAMGGDWQAKDMPLLLNTYVYMVRNMLLRWWRSLVDEVVAADKK